MTRTSGTVKFFNALRGFGFIVPDDGGPDVFVHRTNCPDLMALAEHQRVRFEIEHSAKGLKAKGQVTLEST
jgi:CspA family cold shock protein